VAWPEEAVERTGVAAAVKYWVFGLLAVKESHSRNQLKIVATACSMGERRVNRTWKRWVESACPRGGV